MAGTDGVESSNTKVSVTRAFLLLTVLFIALTRVSPPDDVTPHLLFYLSDLVCPLLFVNSATNFFLRVSPPGGCHPGRSTSSLPPSDAIDCTLTLLTMVEVNFDWSYTHSEHFMVDVLSPIIKLRFQLSNWLRL